MQPSELNNMLFYDTLFLNEKLKDYIEKQNEESEGNGEMSQNTSISSIEQKINSMQSNNNFKLPNVGTISLPSTNFSLPKI
jgi:hypothetical protein